MALHDINKAARDGDLIQRFTAAAAKAGIDNPQAWAEQNMYKLVTREVAGDQDISQVYAYAVSTMPPAPGANPSAVTDTYIESAVTQVRDSQIASE